METVNETTKQFDWMVKIDLQDAGLQLPLTVPVWEKISAVSLFYLGRCLL